MRHRVFGRKLGRNKDERRRLFAQLVRSFIAKGRIHTTFTKAKAVQPIVEKLVTKGKIQVFQKRKSGYTRIVRLGVRRGDASEMAYLEFVDRKSEEPKVLPKSPKKRK